MGSSKTENRVFSVIWCLILFFAAFWIAGLCAGIYILCYCIEACIPAVKGISDSLLKGMQLPHVCAKNMLSGAPLFPIVETDISPDSGTPCGDQNQKENLEV
jgi:hypothetical protein